MQLPYKKVESFDFNGKSYPTELVALRAAIEGVVENAGIAALIMSHACDLAPLLARACELHQEGSS